MGFTARFDKNGPFWYVVLMILETRFEEITGHIGRPHHGHKYGPWCGIRLVLVIVLVTPETWYFVGTNTGSTTSRLEDYGTWCPSVLTHSPGDWKRSPGRHPSRGVLLNTTRVGYRCAYWQLTEEFPEIWNFNFDTHFDVRGITISPPWEHSSSNVVKATWSIEYEQSNNSTMNMNSFNMQYLTQHAKINSECNKLMQPSKSVLKYETNIKTTFKIMNAHVKLKMTS